MLKIKQSKRRFASPADELRFYGFVPNTNARRVPKMFLLAVVFGSMVLGLSVQSLPYGLDPGKVSGWVIGAGALVLGYQQWRAARNETSMDRFYDRLNLSNRALDAWSSARELLDFRWAQRDVYEREMYIFLELDNLEYAIEKYKLGYMSPEHALRGLRTFRARCENSPEFRKLAALFSCGAGYQPTTREVVERICKELDANSPTR